MKKSIHPDYHYDSKVTCSCGAVHVIGSTIPELKIEICSKCHPFYTGTQKLIDTEGRVDKFRTKMKKAEEIKATKIAKKKEEDGE